MEVQRRGKQRRASLRERFGRPSLPIASPNSRVFRNSHSGNRNTARFAPICPNARFFLTRRATRAASEDDGELDNVAQSLIGDGTTPNFDAWTLEF